MRYRFRNIGGTSAGAIAAATTAAAEFGRASGGFDRLKAMPKELSSCLASLFQPARPFRGAFANFLACLGNRSILIKAARVLALVVWHFWLSALVGLIPVLLYVAFTWNNVDRGSLEWVGMFVAGFTGVGIALLGRLLWCVFRAKLTADSD